MLGSVTTIQQSAATTLSVSLIPEEKIGFPRFLSLPYTPNPPAIDGYISDELGATPVDTAWRAAGRFTMANGGTDAHVAFMGLKSSGSDSLYMSFEVRNDPTYDAEDAVVLAFRPNYSTTDNAIKTTAFRADDIAMFIYPFSGSGGAPATSNPNQVVIKKYDGSAWVDISANFTTWEIKVRSFDYNALKAWDMEIKIPTTIPTNTTNVVLPDQFYFYYNVLRSTPNTLPPPAPPVISTQFYYPRKSKDVSGILGPSALYAGSWAKADKTNGVAMDGVWVDRISVGPGDPGHPGDDFYMMYDADGYENTFTTRVKNSREQVGDTAVVPVASPGVTVTLRLAGWGISGANPGPDWKNMEVIAPHKPGSSGAQTVPAGADLVTPGSIDFLYICDLETADVPSWNHQCVYAELNAEQEVYIRQKGTYRNMTFEEASEFSRKATVSVRGYSRPPAGKTSYRYLLQIAKKDWAVRRHDPDTLPGGGAKLIRPGASNQNEPDTDSYLSWTVNGYLCTGKNIIIRGTPCEIANATGAFGYVVHHDGEVAAWDPRIEGARLEGDGSYSLEIPAEGAVEINTRITPVEFTQFSLSLHAGAAFPLANFNTTYGIGFCAVLDATWAFSPNLSLVFMAGFIYLPGANALILPTNFVNLALDLRATAPIDPKVYLYVQGGVNAYVQDLDFSTFVPGFNVGIGGGLILSPRFRLELGGASLSTFTMQNWLIQAHLGIIMRL